MHPNRRPHADARVSRNQAFGGAELLHNFFFAGFGNLEFPIGSVPAAMVGKDVRRLFSPSGKSMWVVDFGGFFTKDSGAVAFVPIEQNWWRARHLRD